MCALSGTKNKSALGNKDFIKILNLKKIVQNNALEGM